MVSSAIEGPSKGPSKVAGTMGGGWGGGSEHGFERNGGSDHGFGLWGIAEMILFYNWTELVVSGRYSL
jgi:hypothetical protein